MPKIESLTAEQWRRVHEECERWRAIGTCTEPADRETTERVISGFYRRLGKEPPLFLWFDGPLSCCAVGPLALAARSVTASGIVLDDQPIYQLGGNFSARVHSEFMQFAAQFSIQLDRLTASDAARGSVYRAQLSGRLHARLTRQLEAQLADQLCDQLQAALRDRLSGALSGLRDRLSGEQLRGPLSAGIVAQLSDQLDAATRCVRQSCQWGAEWCWWVARYALARDLVSAVVGARYAAFDALGLDEWETLVRSGGWWFPFENVCFCAERHRVLSFDQDHRLHCETGPAIECRDGFRVYAWHGTRVPAEWIEQPESLTPETVLAEANMERRRAAADILGWMKLLEALDARVIDEHPDPEIGTLYAVDLPGAPGARILRMRCGTGRWFAQPVPEHIQTAMAAQEWKWRLGPDEYHPEVRT